jgi:3-oxoacyl-[acyl-carrier protein] reductase
MGDLYGKVAVVTGASKGIGAATAKALKAAGAIVASYSPSKVGPERLDSDFNLKANMEQEKAP